MLGDFLRDRLDLTGTHLGCEHGICGACTVSIDGHAARSCITLAQACTGAQVTTIEGFDSDSLMNRLRQAFKEEHALQCGYCTPGMLIAARDLILRHPNADERTIRLEMSGNLCRCTGYMGIVAAIKKVISSLTADEKYEYSRNTALDFRHSLSHPLGPVGSHAISIGETTSNAVPLSETPKGIDRPQDTHFDVNSLVPNEESLIRIRDSFELNAVKREAWELISQIRRVAPCLPGLSIGEQISDDVFKVSLRVNLGPISTNFSGIAQIVTNGDDFSGKVYGKAKDQKSGTSAQGEISFEILGKEESLVTSVQVEIGYSLSGPLAQFSRGSIARDIAKNLTQSFGANMNSLLNEGLQGAHGKPNKSGALSIGKIFFGVLQARLRAIMKWLFKAG